MSFENKHLLVNCHHADRRFFYMAIPTFDIRSLIALTIFVSFHSSEKSGMSGPEKNHFNTI